MIEWDLRVRKSDGGFQTVSGSSAISIPAATAATAASAGASVGRLCSISANQSAAGGSEMGNSSDGSASKP